MRCLIQTEYYCPGALSAGSVCIFSVLSVLSCITLSCSLAVEMGRDRLLQELKCVGPALAQCVHYQLNFPSSEIINYHDTKSDSACISGRATCCPSVHIRFYLCPQHIGVDWTKLEYMMPNSQDIHPTVLSTLPSSVSVPLTDGVADMRARHTPHNYKAAHAPACLTDVCGTQDRNPQLSRNITRVPRTSPHQTKLTGNSRESFDRCTPSS